MNPFSPVSQHLITIQRAIKRLSGSNAADHGLTPNQLAALYRIWELGRCTMSELHDHLHVTTGAVTGVADKLEELGLVERQTSPEDRRICYVQLTPAGRERTEAIWTAWDARIAAWLDRVPADERAGLERALAAMAAAAKTQP